MVSINKIASNRVMQPVKRLQPQGWAVVFPPQRQKDTRTVPELVNTIHSWALKDDNVKAFLPSLNKVKPEHYGVVADTIELAHDTNALSASYIKKPISGEVLGKLLGKYSESSHSNPNIFGLIEEVINNTDNTTSRCFLHNLLEHDAFSHPEYFENAELVKPLVKTFAKDTLTGFPDPNYKNQHMFNKLIEYVSVPEADPEKIKILDKVTEQISALPSETKGIDVADFVQNDIPISTVVDNLKTMHETSAMFAGNGKVFDAVKYLLNNSNLY